MLRKLSSAINSKRLRMFLKKEAMFSQMNTHQSGTVANQIYSQLAAAPKTNNRVQTQFPLVQTTMPSPPPASSPYRNILPNI